MPRSSTIQCPVCTSLDKLSKDYGPRRKVYPDPCPSDIHRKGVFSYGGVEALGSPSFEPVKRLYVRESGVNRPVGHICEKGHVTLDQGAFPAPEGDVHVVTKTWPPSVICRATGEVVAAWE